MKTTGNTQNESLLYKPVPIENNGPAGMESPSGAVENPLTDNIAFHPENGKGMKTINQGFMASDLAKSGIAMEDALRRGGRVCGKGYEIPFYDPRTGGPVIDGGRPYCRTKLRVPLADGGKYLAPEGSGIHIYFLKEVWEFYTANPDADLIITEGEKKVLKALACGINVVGLCGIWMWIEEKGSRRINGELLSLLKNRKRVIFIYDSDANEPNKKDDFMRCAEALSRALNPYDITLEVVILPSVSSEGKTGLDDYLMTHARDEFFKYITANSISIPATADRRKVTSAANGKDGGRPVITKNIADDFGKEFTDDKNNFLLKHYRGAWYRWNGKAYVEIPEDDVEANVMGFLREKYPDNATKNMQANVIANLQSSDMAWVASTVEMPAYIDPQTKESRPAADSIIMDNAIIKLDKLILHMNGENIPNHELLIGHTPELFSSFALPYGFMPDAKCPKWESYVNRALPESESRDALQMLFGLSLVPVTKYNVFFVLYGEGGSGKSVALHVLEKLVGTPNVCTLPLSNIMAHFSTHLLTEKLLNIVGDMPTEESNGYSLAKIEGALKDITGGGNVPVEKKFKDPTAGAAIARCVFATNTLPRFSDRSNGVWDRLRIIPFNNVIRDTPEDNKNLKYELVDEEMSGIFIWAVKGLAKLTNLGAFPEASAGKAIKDKHRLACDHERSFLEEALIADNNAFISAQELYLSYKQFCVNNGYKNKHEGNFAEAVPKVFKGTLKKRMRMDDGRQIFVWAGVKKNNSNG